MRDWGTCGLTVKASRLLVWQLKGGHAADFARSIAVAVTEHHLPSSLPSLLPPGGTGPARERPQLALV